MTSAAIPVPVSATLRPRIVADRHEVVLHVAHLRRGAREGADRDRPALCHGIARVDDEIDDNLLELARVGAHGTQIAAMRHIEADIFAEQAFQQAGDFRDHVGQLEHLRAQRLLPRKGEQLTGERRGAVDCWP